jgi:hypothetical protein
VEWSYRAQDSDQVLLLLLGEADIEALVVEINNIPEGVGRTVMEIWCAAGKPSQDRSLHPADVLPQSGGEGAARISGRLYFMGDLILQRNDGEIADLG